MSRESIDESLEIRLMSQYSRWLQLVFECLIHVVRLISRPSSHGITLILIFFLKESWIQREIWIKGRRFSSPTIFTQQTCRNRRYWVAGTRRLEGQSCSLNRLSFDEIAPEILFEFVEGFRVFASQPVVRKSFGQFSPQTGFYRWVDEPDSRFKL